MSRVRFFLWFTWFVIAYGTALAQTVVNDPGNTITFENASGQTALVRLAGPTELMVTVPDKESRTVEVSAGNYYIKVRYGDNPDNFRFCQGDEFSVEETAAYYSRIRITLHPVVGGTYKTCPISEEEFNK